MKENEKVEKKTQKKYKKDKFYEELAEEVKADFLRRQEERRLIERQWQLNLHYLAGKQYYEIGRTGEVEEEEKYYFWQHRNAYNHIAPIIDARVARLTKVKPVMSVRAVGEDEADLKTAKLTTALLNSAYLRQDLSSKIHKATTWCEVCGTVFYKVSWDDDGGYYLGEADGKKVYEGDVKVEVVSPFEIYPDSLCVESMDDVESIIHARAVRVCDIEKKYGIALIGKDIDVYGRSSSVGDCKKDVLHDSVILIERYERPSVEFPFGRVVAVAEDKILYVSELPYLNGEEGRRDFPFIKQTSIDVAGSFFGSSMIERIIPIQRSYNAVKNRKEEYLNRLTMGVLAVEDGSVDTDDLSEEGLSPGKVVVYRQGSRPPQTINTGSVPSELIYEEERLLNEFVLISGVSELSRSSNIENTVSSGVAIQLLIEQEDSRLVSTAENLRDAVKKIAKQIIRLYKEFATETRLIRTAGENGKVETYYFKASDVSSDDVVFNTENELTYSPAQKKNAVYELIRAGLLNGDDGKLDKRTRAKVLEILGFGSIDNACDIENLHIKRAETENLSGYKEEVKVEIYDDHEIHIKEHTRFLLSEESKAVREDAKLKKNIIEHLKKHKKYLVGIADEE